jgi:hypothetical protein
VLEAALGTPLDPAALRPGDTPRLRLAAAYADLLELQGESGRAMEWLVAIAAADPEDVTGAVDRLGIEFTDLEDDLDEVAVGTGLTEDPAGVHSAEVEAQPSGEAAPPEVVEPLPEDDHGLGQTFDEQVEAEVAELLGEIDPPSTGDASEDGADTH